MRVEIEKDTHEKSIRERAGAVISETNKNVELGRPRMCGDCVNRSKERRRTTRRFDLLVSRNERESLMREWTFLSCMHG